MADSDLVTEGQANDLVSALVARINQKLYNDITITDPTNQNVMTATIEDDGSSTAGWPDRIGFSFKAVADSAAHLVAWFNEYFEIRLTPAKTNTVALRIFAGTDPSDYTARSTSVSLFEVASDRTNRTHLFGIFANGNVDLIGDLDVGGDVSATNVQNKVVCVPSGTTGFASEPDGTLWIEYTP